MHADPETGFLMSTWHGRAQQREATRHFQARQAKQAGRANPAECTARRIPAATALRRLVGAWMVHTGYRLQPDPKGHAGASPAS